MANDIVCQYCRKKIESYRLKSPQALWQGDLPVFGWGRYEGELKRAIAILKYNHHPELGTLLGKCLAKSWQENQYLAYRQKLTIVPIPLYKNRLEQRGFNQAVSIAEGFCQETGDDLESEALFRVKATEAMFELNPAQRKNNLQNAFAINKNWQKKARSKSILLLDDIHTTGTTLKEAAHILRQYKMNVIGAVIIAISGQY